MSWDELGRELVFTWTASSDSFSALTYVKALAHCFLKRQPVWQREQGMIVGVTLEGRAPASSDVEESIILY